MEKADTEKVHEYFEAIDEYVVKVIHNTCLKHSCIATLLLIFAAVDGLGNLTHADSSAKPGERFKFFIAKFGRIYERKKEKLWALRNSLTHNALNVEVFLSRTELGEDHHLREVEVPGEIYINTNVFYRDFCKTLNAEIHRIENDELAMNQAAERLEWYYDDRGYSLDIPFTPPPPVKFIRTK